MASDFRGWLSEIDRMGKLLTIEGADWNLELACINDFNVNKKDCPVLLFDKIKDYPEGFRVVTSSVAAARQTAHTLNLALPQSSSDFDVQDILRQKLVELQKRLPEFPPAVVKSGPILENVDSGEEVDLLKFPVPQWHEEDGGRYIGTGHAVVTRDPDDGTINLGTYRVMVADSQTATCYMNPISHGAVHRRKYHERGERCPMAVVMGHPLIFAIGSIMVPHNTEYQYMGAIREEPVKVIMEEVTGLPVPADSEIVIAGWSPPGKMLPEGPFGEWPCYYAGGRQLQPIIEVERIYYRNKPILLGSPPGRPVHDSSYYHSIVWAGQVHNELVEHGVRDVQGVWLHRAARQFTVVSIKQRFPGHSRQVALAALSGKMMATTGKYLVVVDDDVDITNMDDVIWAIRTRCDPEKDIEILHRLPAGPLDPLNRGRAEGINFLSRVVLDACKPWEWMDEFPPAIAISPELKRRVKDKWGKLLGL